MNKELLKLYDINKLGLVSTDNKQCLCGELVNIDVDICPKCGNSLKKTKLLNINKNNALKKRFSCSFENNIFKYSIDALFSKGFELYENNVLTFLIDKNIDKVLISDTKYFKSNGNNNELLESLDKYLPNFYNFVIHSLKEQEYGYAVTNFSSLTADQLENFLYIYNNYNALIPYLRGYKILNYGKNFNLKDFFPNIDFNNQEDVQNLPIYLDVLLTYDLKNVKYLDSIVEIYQTRTKEELTIFNNCIDKVLSVNKNGKRVLSYNDINDTFSVLYNKDILFEDFIRIYLNSREDYFCRLLEVKKMLKKFDRKFSWSNIEKIDSKLYGTLSSKTELKQKKINQNIINSIYEKLEKNPLEALDLLI